MSSSNLVQNVKKYVSGSHRFINVGNGSTSIPTDTLVTLAKSTIMTIENGNVGIGTTNPLQKLHIEGTSYLNGTITINNNIDAGTGTITASGLAGAITDSTSTTSSSIAASATAVKSAYDLASAALPITGGIVTGNVVILANLTTSNLTVIGDTTVLNTISSNTEQIVITNAGTGPALKITQTGDQPVAEFYDNESELAMTIANNGNIGIGTTNPNYRFVIGANTTRNEIVRIQSQNYAGLEINSSTAFPQIKLTQDAGFNGGGVSGIFKIDNVGYNRLILYTEYITPIQFGTNNSVRMILDSTGKLGIGTTAPAYPLDVTGAVEADRYISTVATGTAPLTVSSTTVVTNLNADLLDGEEGSYYLNYNSLTNAPTPSVICNITETAFVNSTNTVNTVLYYYMYSNMRTFFTFECIWSVSNTTSVPNIQINNNVGTPTFLRSRMITHTSATTVYEQGMGAFNSNKLLHNGTPTAGVVYYTRITGWMENYSGASAAIGIKAKAGATTNTLTIPYASLVVYRDVGNTGF